MLKRFLLIAIISISGVLLLLILDIVKLDISYHFNKNKYQDTFLIQGNKKHYVPQGLAYSNKYDVILQTSYNSNHKVSMLYVSSFKTGKLIKKLKLKESDQSDNRCHVGGIATNNETVWITSDYQINEYSLNKILNTNSDFIQSERNEKLKIRGDFCAFNNHTLWIGDFFLKPFYTVPNNNPLLLAYNDNSIDYNKPSIIISLPRMIQGLTFNDNDEFIFTTSFTGLLASNLLVYENILEKETVNTYSFNGIDVPYYKFNDKQIVRKEELPPMAEGLFYKDKSYYILFENSADTYWYALPKIKRIIALSDNI